MDKNNNVAVALVTYNRKELLIECLEGLLKQTKRPDAVYIIDNASTDKTSELLLQHHFIETQFPEALTEPWKTSKTIDGILFNYVRMTDNTGGAGGFHEGMKRAHEDGYDWIWLMDDDVEPKPEALEKLLEYKHISKCIHPSRESVDGKEVLWEGYIDAMTGLRVNLDNLSFHNDKEFACVNIACFEGMLIHKSIVDKIGYPDKRFFIIYDDTVYGLLASQYTNVIIVKPALMIKKIIKTNDFSAFSSYYFIRNLFLQKQYIDKVYKKYHKTRNVFFILDILRTYTKTIKAIGLEGLKISYKATQDGFDIIK